MKLKRNIAVSESGFLFDPTTGDSFSLNPVALEIIAELKKGSSDSDILSILLSRYEIDKASLEKYFYDFISAIKYYQLIDNNGKN